jgi:hypothetical protein
MVPTNQMDKEQFAAILTKILHLNRSTDECKGSSKCGGGGSGDGPGEDHVMLSNEELHNLLGQLPSNNFGEKASDDERKELMELQKACIKKALSSGSK